MCFNINKRSAIWCWFHPKMPIPAIESICKYCHLQGIYELYFITECDFHAIERCHWYDIFHKYVSKVIAINSRDIFVNIITSPDGDVLRTLGKNILTVLEGVMQILFNLHMIYILFRDYKDRVLSFNVFRLLNVCYTSAFYSVCKAQRSVWPLCDNKKTILFYTFRI